MRTSSPLGRACNLPCWSRSHRGVGEGLSEARTAYRWLGSDEIILCETCTGPSAAAGACGGVFWSISTVRVVMLRTSSSSAVSPHLHAKHIILIITTYQPTYYYSRVCVWYPTLACRHRVVGLFPAGSSFWSFVCHDASAVLCRSTSGCLLGGGLTTAVLLPFMVYTSRYSTSS